MRRCSSCFLNFPNRRSFALLTLLGWIGPDVIDVIGHMNVAGYDRLFDIAEDSLFRAFGLDVAYIERTGRSAFRLEKRIRYEREMLQCQRYETRSRLIGGTGGVETKLATNELLRS